MLAEIQDYVFTLNSCEQIREKKRTFPTSIKPESNRKVSRIRGTIHSVCYRYQLYSKLQVIVQLDFD